MGASLVIQRNEHSCGKAQGNTSYDTAEEKYKVLFHLLSLLPTGSRCPLTTRKKRRHIGHNEAQGVQNCLSDNDPLEPGTGLIHGLPGFGEVHQQKGNTRGHDGGNR